VDSVRLPKQAFFVSRVMQNEKPDAHIIGHWTYPADTQKTVYVAASNCDAVELFVNGQSQGVVTETYTFPDDVVSPNSTPGHSRGNTGFIYFFPNVKFMPGTLKAVALKGGKPVASDEIKTAGAPASIKLTAHTSPAGLQADGSDAAFVDVEVVDAQGNRCPTDEARVDFVVDGPALWRGGINSGIRNSTNNLYLNTECGINRVMLRSTLTAGTITLKATREGLPAASVQIKSNPVDIKNGLTTQMPATFPGLTSPVPNLVP
jgi:beta-galactosidase